jgi:hypothetical protein
MSADAGHAPAAPRSVADALAMARAAAGYLNTADAAALDGAACGEVLVAVGEIQGGLAAAQAGFLRRFGQRAPECRWSATRSVVVLDKAELMPLRILHDHDGPLVVVVPLARPAAAETLDLLAGGVDVVDLDVEVDADLRGLRLWHLLEGQPWLAIKA